MLGGGAATAGVDLNGIQYIDVGSDHRLDSYAEVYAAKRDLNPKVARRMTKRPLVFGGMMLDGGEADLMVAGVANSTALVIQAGALTVGYRTGISTPSSFFLMVLPEFRGRKDVPLIFADCAVNISPTPAELADIALGLVPERETASRRTTTTGAAVVFDQGQRRARGRGACHRGAGDHPRSENRPLAWTVSCRPTRP